MNRPACWRRCPSILSSQSSACPSRAARTARAMRTRSSSGRLNSGERSARASALVAGHTSWHERLEQRIAAFEGTEAALVFPTGYAANLGAITALVGRGTTTDGNSHDDSLLPDRVRKVKRPQAPPLIPAAPRRPPHRMFFPRPATWLLMCAQRNRSCVIKVEGPLHPTPSLPCGRDSHGHSIAVPL